MTPTLPLRLLLSASVLTLGALAATAAAATPVLPTGGSVRAGNATIGAPIGSSLTINQTSTKAVIDWSSFSIGAGGKVAFDNGHGVTLNRVMGNAPSDIFGTLTSTGSVYLLNQNGVFVGKGGAINVGGSFVASSLDMTDNAFMNGGVLTLGGAGRGAVTNEGDIVATSGDVELIGQQVANSGSIRAPGGEVGFAAGQQVTLSQGAPDGEKLTVTIGDPAASITNTGLVSAASAELRANGGNIYALAINAGSRIEATGIASNGGDVYLTAGDGSLTAQGEIDATHADGSGGFVETSGAAVDFTGVKVRAGQWLIDPATLTVNAAAAATIDANLATTSVTLKTMAGSSSGPGVQSVGAGDIIVAAPIAWSSANTLTLDAYHSIAIDAAVSASGAGKVVLITNDGGSGGDYGFGYSPAGFAGSLSFTGAANSGQALTINGQPYTLIFSEADLVNVNNNLGGFYALAAPLDLSTFLFTDAPIASTAAAPFTGAFTGLGNSISGLFVRDTSPEPQTDQLGGARNGLVGLFGDVGAGGHVRDLNLANVEVAGTQGMTVGALAGEMYGVASDVNSSGEVVVVNSGTQPQLADAGGLFGELPGTANNVSSSATVGGLGAAFVGGVAGSMGPGSSLTNSSASGSVLVEASTKDQVSIAGGLVGVVYGFKTAGANPDPATLAGDYATGEVVGGGGSLVGGLAGDITEASVTTSYATGSVTEFAGAVANVEDDVAGGFVGYVGKGVSITQSYASGAVATVATAASATNNVTLAGGFVGDVDQGSSVSDAYALGSVTSTGAGSSVIGGFVGVVLSGSVDGSYATGQVIAAAGVARGFAGVVGANPAQTPLGTIADDYWDETTTGQTSGYVVSGSGAATNVVGIGGNLSPYNASTYANFDLTGVWYIINGETRPILRSEYSTDITNAHQLELMGLNLAANYTLANDIDASETTSASGVWNPANGFVPVGPSVATGFTGSLDGAGHTISNLTIIDNTPINQLDARGQATNGWAGLFGYVSRGGLIENLTISNASVTAGDGIFAGVLAGGVVGSVINSSSSGTVTVGSATNTALGVADSIGGGLVGGFDGLIENSSSSATVSGGDASVGGLVGATGAASGLPAGEILFSHATGAVGVGSAPAAGGDLPTAGGLVGYLSGLTTSGPAIPLEVVGSYATGSVTGGAGSIVGGFAGAVIDSSITTSYATGNVIQPVGGANGASNLAGGFVGYFQSGSTIDKSWASGAVSAVGDTGSNFTFAGGFAGDVEQGALAEKDYALGSVTTTGSTSSALGGFAGLIQTTGSIDQVYATGAVAGPGVRGGLVGLMQSNGSLANSYWDEGTTGLTVAVGVNNGGAATNNIGVGGTTGRSPYAASTYANFNFTTDWYIINGETRPILRAEASTNITDTHQLELMGLNLGASYTLANDIDAADTQNAAGIWNTANGFVPVGTLATPFTGTLDGQGHSIANLTIIDTTAAAPHSDQFSDVVGTVGLFGTVQGPSALIQNLALTNATVTGGNGMDVGGLVGALIEGSVVDVSSAGVVTVGSGFVPGTGEVAYASAGGLIGEAGPNSAAGAGASIVDASSSASITGVDDWSGGLVGHTTPGTSIVGSFASGPVLTGSTAGIQIAEAGGLVGSLFGTDVSGSYATGSELAGSGAVVGGFAGLVTSSQVTTSWASGSATVTGTGGDVGGFAGSIQPGSTITQSFAIGNVSAQSSALGSPTNAGGFAGYVDASVSQAYATGSVSSAGASDQVGGFAGEIDTGGAVDHVYANGAVSSAGKVGGLVGSLGGALSNSYWDEGTTGQVSGFNISGSGAATVVAGMGGTTGVSPFAAATYAGWDFGSTWSTPAAGGFYPELYGVSHVLRVTVGDASAVYGGFPVFAYASFGFQDGDPASVMRTISGLQDVPVGATLSTAGFYNAGDYTLQASGGTASDASGPYRIIYVDGQLNITPRPISASVGGTIEKTYDGTTGADATLSNLSLNGMLGPDKVTLASSGFTSAFASKNAGTGIVVTASGLTLTGADAGDYSFSGTASGAVGVIDPKAITATLTGQVVKAEDGTTLATLGPGNYLLNGAVSGDSVSLNNPTTGVYGSSAVGQGQTVTVTGLALVGADAGDYTVNNTAQAPIGIIQPAANVVQVNIVTTPTGDVTQSLVVGGGDQASTASDEASSGGHPRITPETVFPYASANQQQTQSGDNSPVTGSANGDLWWGLDEDEDKKDKR